MTEEKLRKVVTAITVAATTLFIIRLTKENAKLEQVIEEGKLDAEYFESEIGLDWLAFQKGFIYSGDN